jgi:protein-tyrosine phosphatase
MESSYTWITPNVAIGNFESSYNPFNVIVNLNYPYNHADHNSIHMNIGRDSKSIVYRVGINDSPDEDMYNLLNIMIPKLIHIYQFHPEYKFLFHCYAGISRSSTLAIAFIAITNNISVEDAYKLVLSRRPIINPNQGFRKALLQYMDNLTK